MTEVKAGKAREDMMVKLVSLKVPPIAFKLGAEREVKLTAPLQTKSPPICLTPSREMELATVDAIKTDPAKVEHEEPRAEACAWEVMVAVAEAHREVEDCATKNAESANGSRSCTSRHALSSQMPIATC